MPTTVSASALADTLLTTNHVVAETITLARKIGHPEAATLGESLYAEKLARIHWATPDEERAAFDYFKQHRDQTYSVTDCLSLVVMEKPARRLASVFGFCQHDVTRNVTQRTTSGRRLSEINLRPRGAAIV
jgi:predicted nucleic acid-binding protein